MALFSSCGPEQFQEMENKYETVKRFCTYLTSNTTGAKSTYKCYMRSLFRYSEFTNLDPDQLIEQRMEDLQSNDIRVKRKHEDLAMRYFGKLNGTLSRMNSVVHLEAVKTFYRANHVPVDLRVPKMWIERQEKVPTLEEVKQMVEVSSNPLQRAVIIISAQSGQRAGIISSLKYNMIKDQIELGQFPIAVPIHPNIKNRYGERVNKRRLTYSFFLGQDSVETLKSYLQFRKSVFGDIHDDDFIFVSEKPFQGRQIPLDVDAINRLVKRAAIAAGIMKRPEVGERAIIHHHCLRKFYQTSMEQAGVAKSWFDYMMGHKIGGNDAAYSKPTIDQLREAYLKAEMYLSVTGATQCEKQMRKKMLLENFREQARLFGIDPALIKIERQRELGSELSPDEEIDALREKLTKIGQRLSNQSEQTTNYQATIVNEAQLVKHLEDGWELLQETNGGKYILRKPAV